MSTGERGSGDDIPPALATAHAAARASQDAATVARSAADTATAAHEAVASAGIVAKDAKDATADTVAAAASAAAEIATRAAAAVRAAAVTRALEVAATAVVALETIAADLPPDADPDGVRRAAAAIAATVAADVVAQSKSTYDAATRVADAVRLAAKAAALAAAAAAAIVDAATSSAEASAYGVAGSSAATEAASDVAVGSSTHVAHLARRRVAVLRQSPMVAELFSALEHDELRLHYQPMYSMSDADMVAVEALLRWQHPTRGLLLPAEFLAAVEGPLLIEPIGDWVLETAISQAARWQQAAGRDAPLMWVNIASAQLGRQHLPVVVEQLLSSSGLAPGALGVEITERQLARRADEVTDDLVAVRGLGVATAVDDFGTGYASLDYLRRFTFDEIKIDRSFVSGLGHDRTDSAVTASIIALGRALDLTVVAEGVETQEQYDRLQELGCTASQGYLLHRPAPPEAIDKLLATTSAPQLLH